MRSPNAERSQNVVADLNMPFDMMLRANKEASVDPGKEKSVTWWR
jgi:hypothetical protein